MTVLVEMMARKKFAQSPQVTDASFPGSTLALRPSVALCLVAVMLLAMANVSKASTSVGALEDQADSLRSSDPKAFLRLLDQLDAMSGQATSLETQRLRYLRTYRMALSGHFDTAIVELRKLFSETKNVNLKFRVGSFLVNNYAATRQFREGLIYLDNTLALLPKIQNRDVRHQGLIVAAVFYNQVGQFELGRGYAEQVLSETPSPRSQCMAGYTRLEALFNLEALPAEDALFDTLISECTDQGERIVAHFVRAYLARKWQSQGASAKAIDLLETDLASVEETHYPRLIGEIKSLLADLYLGQQNFTRAEQLARSAANQSKGSDYSLPVVSAYQVLYKVALGRGDPALALDNYRRYAEADKAYLTDVQARELAYQIVHQQTVQKTQTIQLLNQQNRVLQLEQRVSKQAAQNRNLLAGLLSLLLASIAYRAYKIKRVQVAFRRLAETDALTGISNRHHFGREAEAVLAICSRSGQDVGMVMFDLDNFKTINDRFGHATGDWVLQQVANACRALCRPNDLIGRVGGEEFAILLRGCSLDATMSVTQACCEAIAAIDSAPSGYVFPISASFGVASATISGYDFASLLTSADHAMYSSKRGGRNRVSSQQELHQGVLS